jgi:hypothetical protein
MLLQILKKSPLLLCAGAMLVFTSCNGEEKESIDAGNTTTESVNDTPRSLNNNATSGNEEVDEIKANGTENEASQSSPIKMNTEGETNLNPPHGQPGHDCAVPVGKPLPSATGVNMPKINNSNTNNSANLNPPHGEPGHDCKIPVGEPLN